jgi:uncharacterized membrane protein
MIVGTMVDQKGLLYVLVNNVTLPQTDLVLNPLTIQAEFWSIE